MFVGGLASKTTEDTLLKIFSQYGNVVHASVLVDATSRTGSSGWRSHMAF